MKIMAMTLCLVLLSGCASIPRATIQGQIADAWTQISTKEYIRVRGIGAVDHGVHGPTRRRGLSRDAALVAARYNLLALIKGVRISGGITVAQLMEKDSLIREIANEVVSGGEEVVTEWTRDGGCVVTLELKRSKVEKLIQEKSERERGLERRVAKDIKEIKRLHRMLAEAVGDEINGMDVYDMDAIEWKAMALNSFQKDMDHLKATQPVSEYGESSVVRLAQEIERVKELDVKDLAREWRDNAKNLGIKRITRHEWDDLDATSELIENPARPLTYEEILELDRVTDPNKVTKIIDRPGFARLYRKIQGHDFDVVAGR